VFVTYGFRTIFGYNTHISESLRLKDIKSSSLCHLEVGATSSLHARAQSTLSRQLLGKHKVTFVVTERYNNIYRLYSVSQKNQTATINMTCSQSTTFTNYFGKDILW